MLINSLPLVVKCGRMKKNIAHGTSSSRHTKWPSVYQNVAHHIVPMKRRLSTTTAATQAIFDEFSFPFSHPAGPYGDFTPTHQKRPPKN